jgi:hypothetical protein
MTTLDYVPTPRTSAGTAEPELPEDVTASGAFVEDLDRLPERIVYAWIAGSNAVTGRPCEWAVESPADTASSYRRRLLEHPQVRRFLYVAKPVSRIDDPADAPGTIEYARSRNRSVAAVADLQQWLDMSAAEVCDLVSLTPSTFWNWVSNPDTRPRPSTVWRLLATWSIAGMVQSYLGETHARVWWHQGSPSRLEQVRIGGREHLSRLADEVAELARSPGPLAVPDLAPSAGEAKAAFLEMMDDDGAS